MKAISICTYSRNRIEHVRGFFSSLLPILDPGDEVIYVDYSDPQNSREFVASLKNPQIKVYEVPGLTYWQASHAHNCAGVHASKEILFFIDIDVFLTKAILDLVRETVTVTRFISGRRQKDSAVTFGSCAVHRSMFERINGYEEMFTGWAHEDVQFYGKLGLAGFEEVKFPVQKRQNDLCGMHTRENDCTKIDPFNKELTELTFKYNFKNNFQRTIAYGSRLYESK